MQRKLWDVMRLVVTKLWPMEAAGQGVVRQSQNVTAAAPNCSQRFGDNDWGGVKDWSGLYIDSGSSAQISCGAAAEGMCTTAELALDLYLGDVRSPALILL